MLAGLTAKVLAGSLLLSLAGGAFSVHLLIKEREKHAQTRDDLAEANLTAKRTELALDAAEARAVEREAATERQRQDEDGIRDEPETNYCGNSPAIMRALGVLRDRREGDTPALGDPE